MPAILGLGKLRQEDREFKANLDYKNEGEGRGAGNMDALPNSG